MEVTVQSIVVIITTVSAVGFGLQADHIPTSYVGSRRLPDLSSSMSTFDLLACSGEGGTANNGPAEYTLLTSTSAENEYSLALLYFYALLL